MELKTMMTCYRARLFGPLNAKRIHLAVSALALTSLLAFVAQHWVASARQYGSPWLLGTAALEILVGKSEIVKINSGEGYQTRYIMLARSVPELDTLYQEMAKRGWYFEEQLGGGLTFRNCPHSARDCGCENQRRLHGSIGMCTRFFMVFLTDD